MDDAFRQSFIDSDDVKGGRSSAIRCAVTRNVIAPEFFSRSAAELCVDDVHRCLHNCMYLSSNQFFLFHLTYWWCWRWWWWYWTSVYITIAPCSEVPQHRMMWKVCRCLMRLCISIPRSLSLISTLQYECLVDANVVSAVLWDHYTAAYAPSVPSIQQKHCVFM